MPKKMETKEKIIEEDEIKEEKTTRKRKTTRRTTKKPEIKIKIDEELQLFDITVPTDKYTITPQEDRYEIYVHDSQSSIIANQPNIKVTYKKTYLAIEKREKTYVVGTNQNINLNENVKTNNLCKSDDIISFSNPNLGKIEVENETLTLINEEEDTYKYRSNNTLVISEEEKKVYLPYTSEEIKKECEKNKELTISEIIEKKYTKPIQIYKNAISARFREGYHLMKVKEKRSFKDAVLLGLELMFEFNIHPAIIAACKNLEQLDIYLDCLDDNELEKFSCFLIEYKAMPALTKESMKYNKI